MPVVMGMDVRTVHGEIFKASNLIKASSRNQMTLEKPQRLPYSVSSVPGGVVSLEAIPIRSQ